MKGLYYPLGLGTSRAWSVRHLLLHMKSPATSRCTEYDLSLWRSRQDADVCTGRFTPIFSGVADFWEKDLVCRDGVYHVVGDGMHERTDGNIRDNGVPEDPVNTSRLSENLLYLDAENQ